MEHHHQVKLNKQRYLRDNVRKSPAADVPSGSGVEEGVLGGEAGHGLVRRPLLLAPREGAAVPDGAAESGKALSIVMQSSTLRFEGGRSAASMLS